MSDSNDQAHVDNHEGPIKTPQQLIVSVLASFLVPIFGIVLLVNYVDFGLKPSAGSGEALAAEAVAKRLQPVGRVEVRDMSDPTALRTGEQVYTAVCSACHAAGAAGAPKLGDDGAWAPRLKTGYDALLNSALKGKGAMSAQGGGDYADVEVARAVVFITSKAGGKFEEPKVPAVAASAPN